ncbi:hypothetical protein QTI05_22530 [Variovorax sp. J22R193]|uniref:hypothetical protein n=1 Tax=Variovorax fucosicus TaxID=3053517 RepID=UPI00257738BD|nr:hypothetical protein [Variovorax sp. J22R193]MDM0041834.1 hypothetical protein [Variovorax sp. J22R193]
MNYQPPEEDDPRDDDQRASQAEHKATEQAQPVEPAPEWFGALIADVSAIDCRYRGDPSYDHDAYWMREAVIRMLEKRAALTPTAASASAPTEPTPEQGRMLAQTLGECLIAAGIVRKDASLSGPELLMFAEDLKRSLQAEPARVQGDAPTDTEMLDWLEQQGHAYGFEDMHEGNRWCVEGPFATLRKLIAFDMSTTTAKEPK